MRTGPASHLLRLALFALLLASPTFASDQIFMTTNPLIKGDSTTNGFEDQIELASLGFGGYNNACTGGKGSSVLGEISFTKALDQATVNLLGAMKNLDQYTVNISMTANFGGSGPATVQEYVLTNAKFTSYSTSDSSSGGAAFESWTISYSSLEVIYTIYDGTGSPTGTESVTFTPAACVN